jgi:hypothetical protein
VKNQACHRKEITVRWSCLVVAEQGQTNQMGNPSNQMEKSEAGKSTDHDRTMTESRPNTHLKDRTYAVWSPDWSIDHVCLSCQFYDIWKSNPRKALRRVTGSQIQKLNCKMTYELHVCGSRLSPAPLQTDNQLSLVLFT